MKATHWTVAVGVAALVAAPMGGMTSAQAKGARGGIHGSPQGHGGEHGRRQFMAELDLTDAQKQQLKELRKAQRADREGGRDEMRAAQKAMADAIHADTLNDAAIRAAAKSVADLKVERAIAKARAFQQMKTILTPAQLTKLEELKSAHQSRMEARRERREERREMRGGDEARSPEDDDSDDGF